MKKGKGEAAVVQRYPLREQREYRGWKERLKASDNQGRQNLLDKLQQSGENFTERLVEFNVARMLLMAEIPWEYEPGELQKVDFHFGDVLLEVKSMSLKRHLETEKEKIEGMPFRNGRRRFKKEYSDSKVKATVEIKEECDARDNRLITSERIETGTRLKSDMTVEGQILQDSAKFQDKTQDLNLRKAILFFDQAHGGYHGNVQNCAFWYHTEREPEGNSMAQYYPEMFRIKREGRVEQISPDKSILAFLALGDTGSRLLWNAESVREDLKIYTKDRHLGEYLRGCLSGSKT